MINADASWHSMARTELSYRLTLESFPNASLERLASSARSGILVSEKRILYFLFLSASIVGQALYPDSPDLVKDLFAKAQRLTQKEKLAEGYVFLCVARLFAVHAYRSAYLRTAGTTFEKLTEYFVQCLGAHTKDPEGDIERYFAMLQDAEHASKNEFEFSASVFWTFADIVSGGKLSKEADADAMVDVFFNFLLSRYEGDFARMLKDAVTI